MVNEVVHMTNEPFNEPLITPTVARRGCSPAKSRLCCVCGSIMLSVLSAGVGSAVGVMVMRELQDQSSDVPPMLPPMCGACSDRAPNGTFVGTGKMHLGMFSWSWTTTAIFDNVSMTGEWINTPGSNPMGILPSYFDCPGCPMTVRGCPRYTRRLDEPYQCTARARAQVDADRCLVVADNNCTVDVRRQYHAISTTNVWDGADTISTITVSDTGVFGKLTTHETMRRIG